MADVLVEVVNDASATISALLSSGDTVEVLIESAIATLDAAVAPEIIEVMVPVLLGTNARITVSDLAPANPLVNDLWVVDAP